MPIDYARINRFITQSERRDLVARVLRRAGFEVVWVESLMHELWCFHLKLNRHLRELLGTSREILVWVSEFEEFQARAIMQASEQIAQKRPRLSEDFAIVITGDPQTRRYVEEHALDLQTHFVGFSINELKHFQPIGPDDFLRALQNRFFEKDLYWMSPAITSPSAFFGRRGLISELSSQLRRGAGHVGLFGLRKMGKTSLLYRLLDSLKATGSVFTAHIDMERVDAVSPTPSYFFWTLGQQLSDTNAAIRRIKGLRMFGFYTSFSSIEQPDTILEMFDHDVRHVLRNSKSNIVVLLDEIELMSPETPGSRWGDSFVRIWRLLRGLAQENPGRFSFFVTGTNPSCIEASRLLGRDNPIYNYFDRRFLSPFTSEECFELLSRLGARMGLQWSREAATRVVQYVGGHPFLLRAFGSRIHKALSPRFEPKQVTLKKVTEQVDIFLADVNSTLSQMIEVLADQYKDEFFLLETLAMGKLNEFRGLVSAFPADAAHLVGYGLLDESLGDTGLKVELLQTWIQRRHAQRSVAPKAGDISALPPGSMVENYEVLASIGHQGGFASVYKAKGAGGTAHLVALKVFHNGSFAVLQREVDVLQELSHPNIVKILDYGRMPNGPVFLVMEYLEGDTLRARCHRALRLLPLEARETLRHLLEALAYLHPDEDTIERLRAKAELTVEDLEVLSRARHGYIHRDIKPENIVLVDNRGPVLIDFNISVRVATPINTISSTPGYLPPDGVAGHWTPDVDLYQLGITMLQVSAGLEFNGTNLEDLKSITSQELPPELSTIILKLCNEEKRLRYQSAKLALHDMDRIKKTTM